MRARAPHRGSEYIDTRTSVSGWTKASLRLDCRARHAAALVLEAAATWAWLVAPGPRLDGSRSRWRHQPEQIIEVLRLVRLHARDHVPPALPAECQNFFRSLEGSNSHHGWSLLATDLGHAGSLYPASDTEPNSWAGSGITSEVRIRCRALPTLPSSRQRPRASRVRVPWLPGTTEDFPVTGLFWFRSLDPPGAALPGCEKSMAGLVKPGRHV